MLKNKALDAIVRQERLLLEVKALNKRLSVALEGCPVAIRAQAQDALTHDDYYDEVGRPKTHLWRSLRLGGHAEDIGERLEELGCKHCIDAWGLILQRKQLRQRLGASKRAVRAIARAELKRRKGAD